MTRPFGMPHLLAGGLALALVLGVVVAHEHAATTDRSRSVSEVAAPSSSTDGRATEVGTKYRTQAPETVRGVHLYASAEQSGPLTVSIWNAKGDKLGSATAPASATSGWRYAALTSPVQIAARRTYVVSYFAPHGKFAYRTLSNATGSSAVGPQLYRRGAGFPDVRVKRALDFLVTADVLGEASPVATATAPASPVPSSSPSNSAPASSGAAPAGSRSKDCLSDPGACGFPDAGNTGYRHTGVTLTNYTGPLTITKDNTVIDGKLINGALIIRASNVTVKNSKVVYPKEYCTGFCWALDFVSGTGGLVQDVEVDGNGGVCYAAVVLGNPNAVARRVDAHDCGDGFRAGEGSVIEDSYVHDVWGGTFDGKQADSPHNDGIQSVGDSHMRFTHNTLLILDYPSPYPNVGPNAAFQIGAESGTPTDVVMTDNLVAGGGYSIRIPTNGTKFVITGNRFARKFYYGPFNDNGQKGFVWSNNVWDDTGAELKS